MKNGLNEQILDTIDMLDGSRDDVSGPLQSWILMPRAALMMIVESP